MIRDRIIDNLRGFAILMVVLGHAIQYCLNNNFDNNVVFRYIYSFHMPLFFFISGYVNWKTFNGSIWKYYMRARSLLMPYFVWVIVMFLYNTVGQKRDLSTLISIFLQVDYYWFLWVLFVCLTILFFTLKITRKYEELWMCIVWVFLYFSSFGLIAANILVWQLPFFVAGYVYHKYKQKLQQLFECNFKLRNSLGIFIVLLFSIVASVWHRTEDFILPIHVSGLVILVWRYAVGFLGITSVFYLFYRVNHFKIFHFLGDYLGHITLEIYVLHYFFINEIVKICRCFNIEPMFAIIISFIGGLFGSILLKGIVSQNRICNFVFFGK